MGALGLFFRRSKTYFFKALVQDGLQEAFWIDFGAILGGFGEVLGRISINFLEGFWKNWEEFGRFVGRFRFDVGKVFIYEAELALNLNSTLHVKVWLPRLKFFDVRTPALPRFASRSVTMRGGP